MTSPRYVFVRDRTGARSSVRPRRATDAFGYPNRHIPALHRRRMTMASMGRISRAPILAAVGLLLVVGAAQAGSDPVLNCQADKVTAAGIRAACLAGEQAKALQGGKANPGDCEAAFDAALAKADQDAAKKGVTCRYLDNHDGTI